MVNVIFLHPIPGSQGLRLEMVHGVEMVWNIQTISHLHVHGMEA